MFWGLIMMGRKKYSQTVRQSFHLSHAMLDDMNGEDMKVMLTWEGKTYTLCILGKDCPQVMLDLYFKEGEQISLATTGDGNVHLTGYLVPNETTEFDGPEVKRKDAKLKEDGPVTNGNDAKQNHLDKKAAQKVNAKEVQLYKNDIDKTIELLKGAKKQSRAADSDVDDADWEPKAKVAKKSSKQNE